jgi:Ser/Thr protein kinase RdoA (MazF antagonist)
MPTEYGIATLGRLQELVRGAAAGWSMSADTQLTVLNISENATFRLDDPRSGRSLAVRVHRENYHSDSEIRSELAWIEALRKQKVVETPAPIAALDGNVVRRLSTADGSVTRSVVAFEFVPGAEPEASHDLLGWFRELGKLTARMHQHAKHWNPPVSFTRKTWDFDLMLGHRPIWGRWQNGLGLDAGSRDLLARAADVIKTRLQRYGAGPERFGLIHADLRLANLLVDNETMRIIDFDDCGFSWYVYDFATAVSFIEADPIVPQLADAWVAGYREIGPLPESDAAEIPTFIMLRRILLIAWISTHQHSPMSGETGIRYTQDSLGMAEDYLSKLA